MKWRATALLVLVSGASAFADMGSFVTSAQSLQQRPAGLGPRASIDKPYSLTLFSIFSSPVISNLDSAPSVGISRSGHVVEQPTGYSVRHQATFGYHLSETWVLGPQLDFSNPFYGVNSGKILLGDIQLKLTRLNAFLGTLWGNDFKIHWTMGACLPLSQNAHDLHSVGSFTASIIARMPLRDSKITLAGTASSRSSLYDRENLLQSTKFSGGLETSYLHSPTLSSFMMMSLGAVVGPSIDMTTRTNLMGTVPSHVLGMTAGMRIKATSTISLSPILNWFTDSPLSESTLGLTANIQLI